MRPLVLLLFFLSGACGLVYEVVWARMLTHVFGTTALAVGTVLAAFMSGLAVGSWLLGRLADREPNPLRLYALLEIAVGITALGAHLLLERITPAYLALYEMCGRSDAMLGVARFLLAFVLVMAPTLLMGATLPVLARFVVTRPTAIGANLSTLYAINTLGAVAGTLAAGFFLIGSFGLSGAVYTAALGNLAIGGVAWAAARSSPPVSRARAGAKAEPAAADSGSVAFSLVFLVLLGLAISGFTSFAYEIYWTRALVFLIGNSTYAVTTMLTAFLLGIALGGYLARFVVDRVADRVALFGWLQLLIGVTSCAALPILFAVADPQAIRLFLGASSDEVGKLLFSRFGVALLVMLIPTTLIGATFPLAARIAVADLQHTGATVGRVYAVNTVGNVLGALLPGLFLLERLGIQRGIQTMVALNLGVALLVLLIRASRVHSLRWAIPAAYLITAIVLYRVPLEFQFPSESESSWHRTLFYREGPSATTKVLLDPENREMHMSVDGIDIGGNEFTEYKQLLLAHLPKLLADDVSNELSIGLGSGILAGESLRHGGVEKITCVEIEPSVVAGAEFFWEDNHGALLDPRMRVVVDDVANFLRTTPDRYQVISADEKTAQDFASNGFSYSAEYYALLGEHLAPGGLVAQWVPTTLPPGQYRMVLRTFTDAFPHVQLWYFLPALKEGAKNTILIGSNARLSLDLPRMRQAMETDTEAFAAIARYGLTTADSVLLHFVADELQIRAAVRDEPLNTLDRPRYEFFSPSEYASPRSTRLAVNHAFLMELRRRSTDTLLASVAEGSEDHRRLQQAVAAEGEFLLGFRRTLAGGTVSQVLQRFDKAMALAPWNDSLRARIFLAYWETGTRYASGNNHPKADEYMQRALSLWGQSAIAHVIHGTILRMLGEEDRALEQIRTATELDPRLVAARRMLADSLLSVGRREEAAVQVRALLEIEPDDVAARETLRHLEH